MLFKKCHTPIKVELAIETQDPAGSAEPILPVTDNISSTRKPWSCISTNIDCIDDSEVSGTPLSCDFDIANLAFSC